MAPVVWVTSCQIFWWPLRHYEEQDYWCGHHDMAGDIWTKRPLFLGLQSSIRVSGGHWFVVSRNFRITPAWSIGLKTSSNCVWNIRMYQRLDQHLDASLADRFTISNMGTDFGMRTVAGVHLSLWWIRILTTKTN